MGFQLSTKDYLAYLKIAADKIAENKDYVTELDAVTGDGDHWANINKGFGAIIEAFPQMEALPIDGAFKKIGLLMMSKVGGSSGVLYGGGYMAAAKAVQGSAELDSPALCRMLEAMVNDMMERGKAKPGYKTMIDTLYPAVQAYQSALAAGKADGEALRDVKAAAQKGAEETRDMEAVKGRASYRPDKGVGHIDPGAVTMCYQVESLCDYIVDSCLGS